MRSIMAGLALCIVAGCGSESIAPEPSGLDLVRNDATVIEGAFASAGSIVTFESRLLGPEHATLEMDVNGVGLTIDADFGTGMVVMDGGLGALFDEDLRALLALRDALIDSHREFADSLHGTLLVRHVDRMAEAPAGMTLDRHAVDLNEEVIDRGGSCGNDGTTCLPGIGGWSDSWDDTGYNGACTRRVSVPYGNQTSNCKGRCGSGCNWWFDDDMMQDCLDHDYCVYYRGGTTGTSNPNCNDEFWDADGDYVVTYVAYCPN